MTVIHYVSHFAANLSTHFVLFVRSRTHELTITRGPLRMTQKRGQGVDDIAVEVPPVAVTAVFGHLRLQTLQALLQVPNTQRTAGCDG